MIPKDARIYHYFLPDGNPANKVEEYAMVLNDFINLKYGQRPQNALLRKTFTFDFSPVDTATFLKELKYKIEEKDHGYKFIKQRLFALLTGIR